MADGHLHRCKGCSKAYIQQYHAANRARQNARSHTNYHARAGEISAASRERYATDPVYREKKLQSNRAARVRDPVRSRAWSRAYYEKHKARLNTASVARNRAHPAERTEYQRRMRARQKGATEITLTFEEWETILEQHDHACHYCGSREDVGMDHQIPCQRGGAHAAHNVVPCCRSCNTSKGTQTPAEWRRGWLAVA